jgi:uncharacterized protein with HEPN domain
MKKRLKGYLLDVAGACEKLRRFTRGKQLSDYLNDDLLQSAVERQFEIIGEATGQLLRAAPELAVCISHSRDVIGFRNNLIHRYASVLHEVVWDILQGDVPVLEAEVRRLLDESDRADCEPNDDQPDR